MKLSLCMIVGNTQDYIERCLRSFLPLADEVVLVRAIGGQAPDQTMELAQRLIGADPDAIARDVRLVTGEYRNWAEHEGWPHVDDFAAARQMSFDLATGELCFWADTDDVLEEGAAAIVRELARVGAFDAYIFPYRIFGRGVTVPRERMMKRSSGRWLYPVHECFKFAVEPVQAMEDQRVVVTHLPDLEKKGSNERNLRILRSIPDSEMTPGLLYHLQGELANVGDEDGSVAAAKRALSSPALGRPERYELFLNLANMAKSPAPKATMLQQAYATDPRRREALGLLACNAMDSGRAADALAYARQMMATVKPSPPDWNERQAAYGYVGADIFAQALRLNGMLAEAEAVRLRTLELAGGPRIALVHATRGRPVQASMARKVWTDLAERPDQVEHIFVFDEDDPESEPLKRMHHLCIPAGGGCVAAWNAGCAQVRAPVLVQLSDDWLPMPLWDKLVLERLGDPARPRVLAISDGVRSDKLLCMAIMTRAYWELDRFMFHPDFTGVFSDNWFTEVAYGREAVIEARDLRFLHEHPLKTGKPMDETYRRQNAPERYAAGEAVWRRLQQGTVFKS